MKMPKIFLSVFFVSTIVVLFGCAGVQEDTEPDITNEILEVEGDSGSTEGSASTDEPSAEKEGAVEEELDAFDEEDQEKVAEPAEEPELETEPQQQVAQEETPQEESPAAPVEEPAPVEQAQTPAPSYGENEVLAIDYLASSNGGTLEIRTSGPAEYSIRPNVNTNQYVIEIQNSRLADSFKRPLIMKEFDGAFGTVNAYQNPGGRTARIVVQMKSAGEPVVSQVENTLLIMPPGQGADAAAVAQKPEEEDTDSTSYNTKDAADNEKILAARTLDEFLTGSGRFFGRPISIQTNDADIRDVIAFIAEESGVNLVIADDVDGKVSVKLREVPWDQALVIVMRSRSLGYVRQGNVLRITKLSTLQAEANSAKEIVESQKKLTPLKVKVLPVSYAAVEDLVTQMTPFLTDGRGKVVSDKRTSSIIITDTADVLQRLERLVKELDIPPAQVMIEGKIVEASETFTRNVGVNWSLSGAPIELSPNGGLNGTPINLRTSMGAASMSSDQLQAQSAFLNLRVGTLDFLGNLDATLGLAQADSLVRIISSPRVVTMNKEKSEISQSSEVITIQSSTTDRTTTSTATRTPVELKLIVTPQITNEGSVVLDVEVKRQFAGAQADANTRARPINSRQAKTKVLVPNGQTAVIGGVYQSDETESETGTPGLKDVPVLGWLFKQKSKERVKNELLLFLTPRILNAKDQAVN